jgi:hypothetical protein
VLYQTQIDFEGYETEIAAGEKTIKKSLYYNRCFVVETYNLYIVVRVESKCDLQVGYQSLKRVILSPHDLKKTICISSSTNKIPTTLHGLKIQRVKKTNLHRCENLKYNVSTTAVLCISLSTLTDI